MTLEFAEVETLMFFFDDLLKNGIGVQYSKIIYLCGKLGDSLRFCLYLWTLFFVYVKLID